MYRERFVPHWVSRSFPLRVWPFSGKCPLSSEACSLQSQHPPVTSSLIFASGILDFWSSAALAAKSHVICIRFKVFCVMLDETARLVASTWGIKDTHHVPRNLPIVTSDTWKEVRGGLKTVCQQSRAFQIFQTYWGKEIQKSPFSQDRKCSS